MIYFIHPSIFLFMLPLSKGKDLYSLLYVIWIQRLDEKRPQFWVIMLREIDNAWIVTDVIIVNVQKYVPNVSLEEHENEWSCRYVHSFDICLSCDIRDITLILSRPFSDLYFHGRITIFLVVRGIHRTEHVVWYLSVVQLSYFQWCGLLILCFISRNDLFELVLSGAQYYLENVWVDRAVLDYVYEFFWRLLFRPRRLFIVIIEREDIRK